MNRSSLYYFYYRQGGISLIDILLVFALIALLAGLSTPNINKFVKAYRLRTAVSDLSSFLHKAKILSAKNNVEVTLDFEPSEFLGYLIEDSDNNIIAAVSFEGCEHPTINFNRCYYGNIIYESPSVEDGTQPENLTIKPNGLASRGFAYITNREQERYYRVGILSAAGIIVTEKWNGSEWE